jgi:magnesium transporter
MRQTAGVETHEPGIRTRLWQHGELKSEHFALDELSEHLQTEGSLVWVDLCEPDQQHLRQLAAELDLDQHAVEDAVTRGERPKATRHASHTFITAYATQLDEDPDPSRGPLHSRLALTRVSAFVLPQGIITVRLDDHFDIDAVVQRWDDNADLIQHGVGALVHGLLDVVVDSHFETVEQMDELIESLEDGLFEESARTRTVQRNTYRVRKELVELRRVVLPMREVVNAVLRHRTEAGHDNGPLDGWYADLYDHVLRVTEWTESLRDMVTTVFETNLSLQDARLNTVMKKLTGWAAIIAVPTAVTGWFGQNVAYPGFGKQSGLVASTIVIVALASTLYLLFRRRGWI